MVQSQYLIHSIALCLDHQDWNTWVQVPTLAPRLSYLKPHSFVSYLNPHLYLDSPSLTCLSARHNRHTKPKLQSKNLKLHTREIKKVPPTRIKRLRIKWVRERRKGNISFLYWNPKYIESHSGPYYRKQDQLLWLLLLVLVLLLILVFQLKLKLISRFQFPLEEPFLLYRFPIPLPAPYRLEK